MIQNLLWNIQMIWMIFIKILKYRMNIKYERYWSYSIIWLLVALPIKKFSPIITDLFVTERTLD